MFLFLLDEELPDYIMVMVANKKSQEQMTEDLSLFLGNNTVRFTVWYVCKLIVTLSLLCKFLPINETRECKHLFIFSLCALIKTFYFAALINHF